MLQVPLKTAEPTLSDTGYQLQNAFIKRFGRKPNDRQELKTWVATLIVHTDLQRQIQVSELLYGRKDTAEKIIVHPPEKTQAELAAEWEAARKKGDTIEDNIPDGEAWVEISVSESVYLVRTGTGSR